MRIDVWSDVVCPWCYIGKRRLEKAIAGFEHGDEVEVVYHSFQLDPSAPRGIHASVETVSDHLAEKYGMSVAEARQMQQRVIDLAEAEGMSWDHHHSPYANTVDAHRLLHLALETGGPAMQVALKEALFDAYFARARNVGDHDVLRELAVGVGLDHHEVDVLLASHRFEPEVAAEQRQAAAMGATGVPFFVLDGKYGIPGAQATEVFAQALRQVWDEAQATA